MNFVVIGTDHTFQSDSEELEAILRIWMQKRLLEPLGAFAEEYPAGKRTSIAQRLAKECQVPWFNIDMTAEERNNAGILEDQMNRPRMFEAKVAFRIPSDETREEAWVSKIVQSSSGTTIVICGYLHVDSLVRKLQMQGHPVQQRVFLETVPEIKMHNASVGLGPDHLG